MQVVRDKVTISQLKRHCRRSIIIKTREFVSRNSKNYGKLMVHGNDRFTKPLFDILLHKDFFCLIVFCQIAYDDKKAVNSARTRQNNLTRRHVMWSQEQWEISSRRKKSPAAKREPTKYQRLCKTYPKKNSFPSFTENSQPHWWFGIDVRREGNLMSPDLLLYYISMNAAAYIRPLKFFINYDTSGRRSFFNKILLYPIRPIQSSNAWHKNFINTSTPIYNFPVPQVLTP